MDNVSITLNSENYNSKFEISSTNCRVPLGILISSLLGYIWLFLPSTSEVLPAYYTFAVVAVAVSCVIEMMSLSIELVASVFLFVRFKVRINLLKTILKPQKIFEHDCRLF